MQSYEIFSYLCIVEWKIVHIDETDSTNRWIKENGDGNCVVVADYQTAGRGCGTNKWESERGKNLLFSVLMHPHDVAANRQFRISMIVSVALCKLLSRYDEGSFSIKWPNDIYWHDRKICGILIENRLKGAMIEDCVIGIGLNVNQDTFLSDAPNPVSLYQILGQETDGETLLHEFLKQLEETWSQQDIALTYEKLLFRRGKTALYCGKSGTFQAVLQRVEPDGHLVLQQEDGQEHHYAFKELQFII